MTAARDIEAQAARWLIRLEADGAPEQLAAFQAWLNADARNRAAYVRLQAAWHRADRLQRLRPLDGAVDVDLLGAQLGAAHGRPPSERPAWVNYFLVAAVALAVMAAGVGIWLVAARSEWHTYATDFGGLQQVVLGDGSQVNLNTNSELRVRFSEHHREVVLTRGEALFKVAHDPNRAFDVFAGATTVRAIGTAFSVRLRDQQVDVLVTEGRVAIDPAHGTIARGDALPPSLSMVAAGETVTIKADRLQVVKVAADEVSRKLSWMQGRLWFDHDTLADAVSEFNRYNRRQLLIADPAIANIRIGGAFEATDPDSFVTALQHAFGVRAFAGGGNDAAGTGADRDVIRLVGPQSPRER